MAYYFGYRAFAQSLGNKTTKKIAAILVYLTKGSDQNSFVFKHQHGGGDVTSLANDLYDIFQVKI